jgi:DNA-directed RNA polymerase subunit RPC12/RpoP
MIMECLKCKTEFNIPYNALYVEGEVHCPICKNAENDESPKVEEL